MPLVNLRSENGELFADEYDEIFENFEEKSSVFACTFLQDCLFWHFVS